MVKKRLISAPSAIIVAISLSLWGNAFAQQPNLPNTIDVPVTFYDFRSDRSNPEFEQPHQGRRRTGMVAATLDADNKPQLGPEPYRNYGIAHWFRDWNTYTAGPYSKGKNTAPSYTPAPGIRQRCGGNNGADCDEWNADVRYLGDVNVGHDTSFKNIVIPGVLEFVLVNRNTGMYEFSRRGDNMFFPLNGRGFGNEWASADNAPSRNYAFTMELAFDFQARADMVFNFEGDDDVWVFIDNRLVLDIGGIHGPIGDNFIVSNVPGVEVGGYHTLRVFYAERHSTDANIWIQTNIVAPPATMDISTTGNTGGGIVTGTLTKPADETVTLYSVVYDDNGVILTPGQYNCDHVTWTVNNTVVGRGCSVEIADSLAGALTIIASYKDPATRDPAVVKNVNMNVQALPPVAITINTTRNPDTLNNIRRGSDDVYFNPTQSEATVYAVFRDKYGNFAGLAELKEPSGGDPNDWHTSGQSPTWTVAEEKVATVSPSTGSTVTVRKMWEGEGTESDLTVTIRVCGGTLAACSTLSATVGVGSKSTGAIAVGPPFIPGFTMYYENFPQASHSSIQHFYRNAVSNSNGGSGHGILIAADAPKPLWSESPGADLTKPYGRVIIYDAVGNVVRREHLYRANSEVPRSYGYVWDGKNEKGRYVGPGTYLVRVSGREVADNGGAGPAFFVQRKIGVTR